MSFDPARGRSGSAAVVVLVVIAAAVAAAVAAFWIARGGGGFLRPGGSGPGEELPVLGQAPSFELVDQEGRPFSSGSLAGKAWVANFMFTRCANTCPAQAQKLAALEAIVKSVPGLAAEIRLVSLSVDAERDRPADLKAYAEGRGADPALWVFLTGPPGAVARLSQEGFQLAASAAPGAGEGGEPAITHSDRFLLVDREGRLRGRYRPTVDEADAARLARDLRRLAGR
jgi:protein SCO1/2